MGYEYNGQQTCVTTHAFMLSRRFSNAVLSIRALRLHVVVRTTRGVLFMRATFWVAAAPGAACYCSVGAVVMDIVLLKTKKG